MKTKKEITKRMLQDAKLLMSTTLDEIIKAKSNRERGKMTADANRIGTIIARLEDICETDTEEPTMSISTAEK